MSLIGSIVVFVNLWMIILFMVLPWGVRNQLEEPRLSLERISPPLLPASMAQATGSGTRRMFLARIYGIVV